ncbi:MAG TPA: FAD-dependent oxidoreductase [Gemmatimonadaceae bacterium]|nr:FAD-dependent oxidoreductase [Gemmatimonadaceae bacterium]
MVAGDGVIGLATAVHLAARSVPVTLLSPNLRGAASPASAGMLAPSVERTQGAAQTFGDVARDAWPRLAQLLDRLGGGAFDVQRGGILQVARTPEAAAALRTRVRESDQWMTGEDAQRLEPALARIEGAVLHHGDGVVDGPAALAALRSALAAHAAVTVVSQPLAAVRFGRNSVTCELAPEQKLECDFLVVAAGSWTTEIGGLPRAVPVRPLRGAMVAADSRLIRVPIYDASGHSYALPRGSRTVVGATSDDVGFDAAPADGDAKRLVSAAAEYLPGLRQATVTPAWAGLRPVTPDGLAVIGPDPDEGRLLWATGHARNGFLQAALTGEVIAAIVHGEPLPVDISPFWPGRFPQ